MKKKYLLWDNMQAKNDNLYQWIYGCGFRHLKYDIRCHTATTGDLSSVLCSNCTDEMLYSDENNFYWFISEMFEREKFVFCGFLGKLF